jgi:GT2 family glycosyltransferase
VVTVVTPSYGRFDRVLACVDSVMNSIPVPVGGIEVVIVTAMYSQVEVAELRRRGCKVLEVEEKLPTSASRNAGAAIASGNHLLFLDDDNVVAPDAISKLYEALRSWPDAVLVGPAMFYGTEPERLWCAGVRRSRFLMKTNMLGYLTNPMPGRLKSEDFPNCFMLKVEDFQAVGGFDAKLFPQHYEEADLARRLVRMTGRRVFCAPTARVWHFIAPEYWERLHLRDESRAYFCARGRAVFTAVYGDTLQWLTYLVIAQWLFAAGYLVTAIQMPAHMRRPIIRGYLRGLYAGFGMGLALRGDPRRSQHATITDSAGGRTTL